MAINRQKAVDVAAIFFCGLVFFTFGLQSQEIIGFESRFYLFALEMWRHGFSWFPTTYHAPYPDYPGTSTALVYLTAKLTGVLNKWTAVFPSACAAAFTLCATYLLGAVHDRRWGWLGAGFLLFTLAFLMEARTISLDMYVTAFTAWLFYFVYTARSLPWLRISLLLIAGFAIRGPIGVVIPVGVICVFYLLEKDWKRFLLSGVTGFFILLSCTAMLLWLAYRTGGTHFMHDVLRMEIIGRMQENRTPPHYFYFIESLGAYALTYPLLLLMLPVCIVRMWRERASAEMRFLRALCGWVFVILLGLSIPADKKIRYVLPMAPALALFCAYLLAVKQTGYLQWLKKKVYLLCWLFPLLGLGALSMLYYQQIDLNYRLLTGLFVGMQILMLMTRKNVASFFLAVISFVVAYIFIVETINLQSNKTRDFVQTVERLRVERHAKLGFYREGRDGLVIKYLLNMPKEEMPLFVNDFVEMPHEAIIFVTSKENLPGAVQPLMTGKIGHDEVVVFSKP